MPSTELLISQSQHTLATASATRQRKTRQCNHGPGGMVAQLHMNGRQQGKKICPSFCLWPAGSYAVIVTDTSTLVSTLSLLFDCAIISSSMEEWGKGEAWAGNERGGFVKRKNANVQLERDVAGAKQWQGKKKQQNRTKHKEWWGEQTAYGFVI